MSEKPQHASAVGESRTGTSRTAPASPLVLIVDDAEDSRAACAAYLKMTGMRVLESGDGHDAVAQVRGAHPDLVIMDLSMPEMDGWETIRQIRADRTSGNVPIVVLTGYGLAGHEQARCQAYLVKPCLPDDLVSVVRSVLETRAFEQDR